MTLSRPSSNVDVGLFRTKADKLVELDEEMKKEFATLSQSIPAQAKQMLSELALNERLERIKATAARTRLEEVEANSDVI